LCSRSSSSGPATEPEWLIVGRVGKPHGVHGDVLVDIVTDFPERLTDGLRFGLGGEDGPTEYHEVFRVRYHKRRWLLSVAGLRDRTAIEAWRGKFLFLPALALEELPEGYHYEHHLVGLECVGIDGESLGTVTGVDPGAGGQRRLVVRRDRRDFLVPYVPEIVREVDLERRRVVLAPPRGLLDDDAVIAD
jgi:16S rRNA processing protein RimM